jgi:6-pyruvoyltetrahydropterin/6-carboxytetrahydropterin synthase
VNGLAVTVRHTFETAHRLPALGGKCVSLHGHSWQVEWTVAGTPDEMGVLVEYGHLKRHLREWVDTHLDHGTMLGEQDPLREPLEDNGCKVFTFGRIEYDPVWRTHPAEDLPWPTVENVAVLLARVGTRVLADVLRDGYVEGPAGPFDPRNVRVAHVRVQETAVNAAEWTEAPERLR